MRERNHKCENCVVIYVTIGSQKNRLYVCEACRPVVLVKKERDRALVKYHTSAKRRFDMKRNNYMYRLRKWGALNKPREVEPK